MNDAKLQRPGNPAILAASLLLFALFAVQAALQVYRAYHNYLEVDTDLSTELAEAVFLEDEPKSADWPQWRGPHRDGVVHMDHFAADWPTQGLPLLWDQPIGLGYSSFAVKNGRIYSLFQEDDKKEAVACWDLENGKEVWRHPYECHAEISDYPGPRSTPTVDGDRVYTTGSDGTFLCLDAATGSPHWQINLLRDFQASSPKWGVAFSPLIDGDLVFTSPGGKNGNSLSAFNKLTGELVWKALDEPAGYSSPVAVTIGATRQIVFFLGRCLVGVRAENGELCWRYPWETTYDVNAATPVVFPARRGDKILHYVFISSGYGRGCALLKIEPRPGGGFEAKKVYAGKQMGSHFASPVRRGEYLYGIDDTRLSCLNLRTGKVAWKRSGIKKGSLLRLNDFLLVLGEEGNFFLLEAKPEKRDPLAEARPFRRGRCWTMPVVAEGRLLLRNEERMKCFDLRTEIAR